MAHISRSRRRERALAVCTGWIAWLLADCGRVGGEHPWGAGGAGCKLHVEAVVGVVSKDGKVVEEELRCRLQWAGVNHVERCDAAAGCGELRCSCRL